MNGTLERPAGGQAPAWQLLELPTGPALDPVIGALYYLKLGFNDGDRERRVVVMAHPSVDLVVNLGGPFTLETFGVVQNVGPGAVLLGPQPLASILRREDELELMGARFRHGAASSLLPYPVKELEQRMVPLAEVLHGHDADLAGLGAKSGTPEENLKRFSAVLARLFTGLKKADPLVRKAVKLISTHNGDLEVSAMAEELGVSRQTVKHKFDQHLGLSPKLFGKLCRFQAVVRRLASADKPNWVALAKECGYYDQAHMIREFNHFTGFSPQKFLNNLAKAEDLYIFEDVTQTHFHMAGRFKALAGS